MVKRFKAYVHGNRELKYFEEGSEGELSILGDTGIERMEGADTFLTDDYSEAVTSIEPFINTIAPDLVSAGSTVDIQVSGYGLTSTTEFAFTPEGVTVNSVNVSDPFNAIVNVSFDGDIETYSMKAVNGSIESLNPVAIEAKNLTILTPNDGTTSWGNVSAGATVGVGTFEASSANGWDKAATFGSLPANQDGFLEFTHDGLSSNSYIMVGLNDADYADNNSYQNINFALYIANGTGLSVREIGSQVFSGATTAEGDKFKIERVAGVVTYYKNGTQIYQSNQASTQELFFDCSSYRNSKLKDIRIVY